MGEDALSMHGEKIAETERWAGRFCASLRSIRHETEGHSELRELTCIALVRSACHWSSASMTFRSFATAATAVCARVGNLPTVDMSNRTAPPKFISEPAIVDAASLGLSMMSCGGRAPRGRPWPCMYDMYEPPPPAVDISPFISWGSGGMKYCGLPEGKLSPMAPGSAFEVCGNIARALFSASPEGL